jgi:methanogenic corrinoid protein MtbC1
VPIDLAGEDSVLHAASLIASAAGLWFDRHGAGANAQQRRNLVDDMDQLLCHLDAAVLHSPPILNEYLSWAKSRAPDAAVRLRVECMATTLVEAADRRAALLLDALEHFDQLESALAANPTNAHPLADLSRLLTELLLDGQRLMAERLVVDALNGGAEIRDIYLYVFQPALRQVGQLWQQNRITVADEHFFSAAVQMIMARLHDRVFRVPKKGPRLLATCAPGELHEIGMRMIADLFELDGWPTDYLGADTPADDLIAYVVQRDHALIAISSTMACHVPAVAQMISQLRAAPGGDRRKILVGGHPFVADTTLWRSIGADATAPDAEAALATGRQLMSTP